MKDDTDSDENCDEYVKLSEDCANVDVEVDVTEEEALGVDPPAAAAGVSDCVVLAFDGNVEPSDIRLVVGSVNDVDTDERLKSHHD